MKPALTPLAGRTALDERHRVQCGTWKPLAADWDLPTGESLAVFALDRGFLAPSLLSTKEPSSDESHGALVAGSADRRDRVAPREAGTRQELVEGRR